MSALDWGIVAAFLIHAIVSGLRSRRAASRNLEEYFLAGRELSGWQAGLSMAATQFAADTPLLVTGLIATAGIFALWQLWIYALAFLLLGFVLAPSWRRAGVVTDAELAEARYAGRPASVLRGLKAIYFGTIMNCTVLAMVLLAATVITEPFFLWNEWLPHSLFASARGMIEAVGVPFTRVTAPDRMWILSTNNLLSISVIFLVTLLYSMTGGLRSVVRTDVVQLALMLTGTAIYAGIVVVHAGGLESMHESLQALAPIGGAGGLSRDELLAFTPGRAHDASFALLAVFALQWIIQRNADGSGYLAQRSMACRNDHESRKAAVVFTFTQIVLRSLLWLPIGIGLLVLFPPSQDLGIASLRADREATFVRGMRELLPTGALGLMLTAMLAALASTLDTHLNWGASYWANDLYRRFLCRNWLRREPSARELVWVARGSNVLILILALWIMTHLASIEIAWRVSLLLGAGLGVILVWRWLWWRLNAWGELASIAASMLLAPLLLFGFPQLNEATRLLLIALGSTLAGIGAALLTPAEPHEHLRTFYARVRPPGWWGPIARACGADPRADLRRLLRGLGAAGLASVSAFSLLAGLGIALLQSPVPAWIPSRSVFVVGNLMLGLALIPLWWRLGFPSTD